MHFYLNLGKSTNIWAKGEIDFLLATHFVASIAS